MAGRWRDQAACIGQSDLFVPRSIDENRYERWERQQKAKAICKECPVRRDCLEFALREQGGRGPKVGVWAGVSADFIQKTIKDGNVKNIERLLDPDPATI